MERLLCPRDRAQHRRRVIAASLFRGSWATRVDEILVLGLGGFLTAATRTCEPWTLQRAWVGEEMGLSCMQPRPEAGSHHGHQHKLFGGGAI